MKKLCDSKINYKITRTKNGIKIVKLDRPTEKGGEE